MKRRSIMKTFAEVNVGFEDLYRLLVAPIKSEGVLFERAEVVKVGEIALNNK
ncbi:hypothetical protein C5S32_08480 [ANME-1 cluster archaeon GoMg1]|nr:hypothetical protein [ANME-1 cluster archaeon GoMg1]